MNTRRHYTTYSVGKKELTAMLIIALAAGMLIGAAMACLVYTTSVAEDELTYRCWVVCKPQRDGQPGEVLIRERPDIHSGVAGSTIGGRQLWTDWREENGWLHLVDVSNESGEGWIYEGYISFTEPIWMDVEAVVKGRGRVACRNSMGGKLKSWANVGTMVTVYAMTDEWAVTDRGYIMLEYLEVP